MKKTIFSLALLATTSLFAQKSEIKDAQDAIENEDFSSAISYLKTAKKLKSDLNEKWLSRFYLAQGQSHSMRAFSGNSQDMMSDIDTAVNSYEEVIKLGRDVEDANIGISNLKDNLVNSAIDDQKKGENSLAADKLYKSYEMNEQDTMYLYYAASSAVNARDYDEALTYYKRLMDLEYTGVRTNYIATDVESGEEVTFNSKEERDFSVKSDQYTNPKDDVTESVRGEIAKNISLIYIQQEKTDEALIAIEEAKKENPNDIAIIQAEADLHYRLGNLEKYSELMKKAVEQDPDNADLLYNLGVSAEQLGDVKTAQKYYKQAIELNPEMENAYINMATTTLSKEREIVEEMNSLGTSKADNKKYQKLNEEKKQYYSDALPYLEKAIEINPQNIGAMQTMMNIYFQLGKDEKAEEIKSRIDEIRK
ncbi:tetratricopeptide repeat protein [Psychroflexus halocasei]|uniref:Tetratricopeptide repeat-containing protein n=1 Tax=Psychroflexus halocasei TaxID=908615 RepID=A0A1H3ZE06_9FLAO|nr:tetratricopeptide repeat protein [Psychroflexus halocasei]SEA21631.1 Tetratricopeptide repeat-containing protein [Psychroflexus halocasei]